MAEATQITFTHQEVVEALLKKQGVHEGLWAIYIKFGIRAANVGGSDASLMPSAIVPVLEIGIQKSDSESNLSVDAAKSNPRPKGSPWPRLPVEASTPGTLISGCPPSMPSLVLVFHNSDSGKNPFSARSTNNAKQPWPLLKMNRSLPAHLGFFAS